MNKVISSWKEIAAFVEKKVRTVQQKKKTKSLPIHRPGHNRKIVLAYRAELAEWIEIEAKNIPHVLPDILVVDQLQKEVLLLREELSAARVEIERVRSQSSWLRAPQESLGAQEDVDRGPGHRRSPRSA